jgi:selT/selW/selH-like putative selenoprotein
VEGAGGVFEVEYGGKLVFSKAKLGRFPEEDEVAALIKKP